ncbi:hypothetical protein ACFU0X_10525 [Streptomyces cellulosae]|uniref:3'-5' exonuclease n=1 Tax=Streptomyces cellulosae TaxID=1968 RepID=A0ABW6JDN4_STRCE
MQTTPAVPSIDVPRYQAPHVTVARVTELLPTEPVDGRLAGRFQHLRLNARTGELSFYESNQHLTPHDPAWDETGVPAELRQLWHLDTVLVAETQRPRSVTEVSELLHFQVDSGHADRPYLNVVSANKLLDLARPIAQELLDGLYNVDGQLDWSAASWHASRNLTRLASRHANPQPRAVDCDLVDFADVVTIYPRVFEGDVLDLKGEALAKRCATISRFLGCLEGWHPEITQTFGRREPGSNWVDLSILGVWSWYRAVILAGDPRPVLNVRDWEPGQKRLAGHITSSASDAELRAWARDEAKHAAREGYRLEGARRAAHRRRSELRRQEWQRMAVVAREVVELREVLAPLLTERAALLAAYVAARRSDEEISVQLGVGREEVARVRAEVSATA